jgi:protein involved in polysaccharide export with SLBB domain
MLEQKTDEQKTEAPPLSPVQEMEGDSLFDRYRRTGAYQEIDTQLKPFGYDFFASSSVQSMSARKDLPVAPDYIVGPGDEVNIVLWGRVTAQYNLVIDKDGKIIIPQIGPLNVAGMTYEQMATEVIKKVEQIVGANVNVTLGTLKSIQVFVTGDIKRPGSYTLDSFSTITAALLSAGGPSHIGSLRNIQLKRNNKVIAEMDFYAFLLKGDKSKDLILKSGDVVFVPTVGALAGIAGNVRRPAIYQLKGEYDLQTLLDLSGGLIPSAYTQQIQVSRIVKNERQIVVDINDKNLSKTKEFTLQDGDLVKVFPIVDKDSNAITLSGNVKRPGKYEYKQGIKIADILKSAADLLPETDFDYGLIKRLRPPTMETELIPFDLKKVFAGDTAQNIELRSQDVIYIFSKWFFKNKPFVTVEGEVRKPGKIDLLNKMTLRDAILNSEGLARIAYRGKAAIIRVDERRQFRTIYVNLEKAMAEDPRENILLQDEDRIVVHSIDEVEFQETVSVLGNVKTPGKYQYVQGMKVSDLVFTAGNVLPSSYLGSAEIISQVIENGKIVRTEHKNIDLKKALEGDPEHNRALKPYDTLTVKKLSDWGEDRLATISGEVLFPGTYKISKGEKLSDLIQRAGGYSENAYLRGAVFSRERVKQLQQKNIDEMVDRLERQLLVSAVDNQSVKTPDPQAMTAELEAKRQFLAKLREVKATGRMSIRLTDPENLKKTLFDIELDNGDSLSIPSSPNSVQVIGAVYNQSAFIYDKEMTVSDYIDISGGYAENADDDNVYILKVDGTAVRAKNGFAGVAWNKNASRWELASQGVESGDTIVVPEELEKINWLKEIKDITQILYQIAVTAGVLIVGL